MHIGILQADTVLEKFQPAFGDYPEMFVDLLGNVDDRRPRFTTIDAHVAAAEAGYPAPRSCDAYVITCSHYSVYDDEPWIAPLANFVGDALDAGRKVVGICFGHQLIAHYFGGRTAAAPVGWGVGVYNTELISHEPWMDPAATEVALVSSHKDQVFELPDGARLIARNDFCPNAGFVIGDQVLTLQGHPEFSKPYAEALLRHRRELVGEATFQEAIASFQKDTHPAVLARWILNFIERS